MPFSRLPSASQMLLPAVAEAWNISVKACVKYSSRVSFLGSLCWPLCLRNPKSGTFAAHAFTLLISPPVVVVVVVMTVAPVDWTSITQKWNHSRLCVIGSIDAALAWWVLLELSMLEPRLLISKDDEHVVHVCWDVFWYSPVYFSQEYMPFFFKHSGLLF